MSVHVEITDEKFEQLAASINNHMTKPGPLMPVLHDAQRIFGCIPIEVQKYISKKMGISVAEINGVVTFYSSYTTEPKGKHIVGVCLGTPCYVRGSQIILDAVKDELKIGVDETTKDGVFTLEAIRCIGTCGMAPVMSVDNDVYGEVDVTKAKKIIKKYL